MAHVLRALTQPAEEQTLLLGDLNALTRADYTESEWGRHEAHNAARGWDAPHDDAAADLGDDDFFTLRLPFFFLFYDKAFDMVRVSNNCYFTIGL